jgi:hypothetical protein
VFKISFKAPKFGLRQGYTKTVKEYLRVQIRQAAREFVREAVVRVPVDTGQARGTFLPLGRFLNVSVPIPGANAKFNKSEDTGAEPQNQLLFRFTSTKTGESFEIDPQLFYFWFNDFFAHSYPNAQLPTPWGSLEAGWEAFMEYMRVVAPQRFPRIEKFITMEMKEWVNE